MSEPNGPTEQAAYERELKHRERELALKKGEQTQKAYNDKMMLWVTTVSVFVAALATIAAFLTVREARRARIEARDAADHSYNLQRQTFDAEERPFLAIDLKEVPEGPQPRLGLGHFALSLVGVGKTPARNIRFSCAIQPNIGTVLKWYETNADFVMGFKYILPSRSEIVGCKQLREADLKVEDGVTPILAFGVAEYEDDEKRQYRTPFCEVALENRGQPTQFVQCAADYHLPELR